MTVSGQCFIDPKCRSTSKKAITYLLCLDFKQFSFPHVLLGSEPFCHPFLELSQFVFLKADRNVSESKIIENAALGQLKNKDEPRFDMKYIFDLMKGLRDCCVYVYNSWIKLH